MGEDALGTILEDKRDLGGCPGELFAAADVDRDIRKASTS